MTKEKTKETMPTPGTPQRKDPGEGTQSDWRAREVELRRHLAAEAGEIAGCVEGLPEQARERLERLGRLLKELSSLPGRWPPAEEDDLVMELGRLHEEALIHEAARCGLPSQLVRWAGRRLSGLRSEVSRQRAAADESERRRAEEAHLRTTAESEAERLRRTQSDLCRDRAALEDALHRRLRPDWEWDSDIERANGVAERADG